MDNNINNINTVDMEAPTIKLENCEVCAANKAKYTCPKCEVRTCCLNCVNIHKKELDCDGIRDKTKFVQLKSFTDLDVLSDYRLLEEVGRSIDQLQRDPLRNYTRQGVPPMHLQKLKMAANRRKINLLLMPQSFIRHRKNTTYLNWKTNELSWRIEWVFPQAEHMICITERAPEGTSLSKLLEKILLPEEIDMRNNTEELNPTLALNDKLQYYRAVGLSGVKVLLKSENVTKSSSRFYELDLTLSLNENLRNRTIIEFPTLHVIVKHHSDMYEIIDSDEDVQPIESHNLPRNNERKRMRMQSKHKIPNKNMPVNYFFNTEFAESDDETPAEVR